jgi:hypothetical protein
MGYCLAAVDGGSDLRAVDRHLVWLAHTGGRQRLRIGHGLDVFFRLAGHHGCGFSTMAAYAAERLGHSIGWVKETRKVAVRCADLPLLREAYARGEIKWTKLELVTRHARPDDDAEMLALARASTVRELRKHFRDRRIDPDLDPDEQTATLRLRLRPEESWLLDATRSVVALLDDGVKRGEDIEWILAEDPSALTPPRLATLRHG